MHLFGIVLTIISALFGLWILRSSSKEKEKRPAILSNSLVLTTISFLAVGGLIFGLFILWRIDTFIVLRLGSVVLVIFLVAFYRTSITRRKATRIFKLYRDVKEHVPILSEPEVQRQAISSYYKTLNWNDERINIAVEKVMQLGDTLKSATLVDFANAILIFEKYPDAELKESIDLEKYKTSENKIRLSVRRAFDDTFPQS